MSLLGETVDAPSEGQRTSALSVAIGGIEAVRQTIIPVIAVIVGARNFDIPREVALGIAAAIIILSVGSQWVRWARLRYFIGETDIRVESGLLSLAKRSVPYERIQDVSLEQKLLPRLFGLVAVKFETGAGGKDELHLAYVTSEEGARLRELVRERQDSPAAQAVDDHAKSDAATTGREDERILFEMKPRRVLTFGLFEFSLVIFAVLAGAAQQFDFLLGVDPWDGDYWRGIAGQGNAQLQAYGRFAQLIGALAGLVAIIVLGIVTGVLRTALREWDFRLTRTAKGFRRRRGLLTKTDVLMPVHRVQAARLGTGWVRRLFGWHSLKFVSLAQDSGAANHDVAPFAKRAEIDRITAEARIALHTEATHWLRPSSRYWVDRTLIVTAIAAIAGTAVWLAGRETIGLALFAGLTSAAIVFNTLASLRHRFAKDDRQLYIGTGLLAPQHIVAPQECLQSVEIARGPLAGLRGYCTVHFGLPGGTMAIRGIARNRADEFCADILDRIARADYSLVSQPAPDKRSIGKL